MDGSQLGVVNVHEQPMPAIGKIFSRFNYSCEFFEIYIIEDDAGLRPREFGLELNKCIMGASLALFERFAAFRKPTHHLLDAPYFRLPFTHAKLTGFIMSK